MIIKSLKHYSRTSSILFFFSTFFNLIELQNLKIKPTKQKKNREVYLNIF